MRITAFAGGVGGAKLAHGLAAVCKPDELTVIVNTADDFQHFGLYICPDLDTVMYTLAEMANPETGWGIRNDSYKILNRLEKLGGPTWFQLGDQDIATHLERTRRLFLKEESLTEITLDFCRRLGIKSNVLPMCNEKVSTMIHTKEYGQIPFQEYFVKYRFSPISTRIEFDGIEKAKLSNEAVRAIEESDFLIFCPSNPFVSINPILAIHDMKDLISEKQVIAVSPIVAGKAVKGPLDKMLVENGYSADPVSIGRIYEGLIDFLVIDNQDEKYESEIMQSGIIPLVTDIMLPTLDRRKELAIFIIDHYYQVRNK